MFMRQSITTALRMITVGTLVLGITAFAFWYVSTHEEATVGNFVTIVLLTLVLIYVRALMRKHGF